MSKSKANPAPKQENEVREAVIGVSARAYLSRSNGPTLANITVDLGGEYAVKGIRVVQGKNGPFVAMPQRQVNGEFQDIVFAVTKEARERLIDAAMGAYEQALEQTAKQAEAQERPAQSMSMAQSM
ncbi:MAG: SpoVG family protein [Oscillospiraceae bacterium]|nr:SpoVG family protein [Oscillospiraceae bacterium]